MPRRSKGPWKRKQDGCYYTTVNDNQVKLTEAGEPYSVANKRYHEVHAHADRPTNDIPTTVAQILDEFLEWSSHNQAESTYRWYRNYLVKFHLSIGSRLLIASLKPLHVERWIQSDYKGASNNNRRGAIKAAKRALNWAIDMGIVMHNPIARMPMPTYEPCEEFLTQGQYDELMESIDAQCFKDYLNFLWLTGCRPQEIRVIEAKHVQGERIVLQKKNSKGKKFNRTIYLTDESLTLVKRLCKQYPTGPIFRNSEEETWTSNAVRCRFRQLGIKMKARWLRHSWITRALENKVDTTTVSILAGHRDTTMVQRNYQHLTQNHEFLAEAAKRARGGESLSS